MSGNLKQEAFFLGGQLKRVASLDVAVEATGLELRQTVGHEGTHIVDFSAWLQTYDPRTKKFGPPPTELAFEEHAFSVGSKVMPYAAFTSRSQMRRWIRETYGDSDKPAWGVSK